VTLTHDRVVDDVDEQPLPPRRSASSARSIVRTVSLVLALAAIVLAVLLARGWRPQATNATTSPTSGIATMPVSAEIEATYGIRFTGVDVTAGGGMIQIRYQVLDSAKTEAIHGTDLAPVIVDSHGITYADPGMAGHSHVGKTQAAGTTDYILLANAQGGVTAGSIVTIQSATSAANVQCCDCLVDTPQCRWLPSRSRWSRARTAAPRARKASRSTWPSSPARWGAEAPSRCTSASTGIARTSRSRDDGWLGLPPSRVSATTSSTPSP
jgi:hypothetical protein